METGANGFEKKESSYSVIAFPGHALPENYRNMVYTKWLRSLKYGNDYFKLINSDAYYKNYEPFIKSIMARPGVVLRIAALTDDRDVVLGWSAIEGDVLHYVFVLHEQRNKGIANALVPVKINTITHLTKNALVIWPEKFPNAQFNPFQ